MVVPHGSAVYPVRPVSCVIRPPDSLAREDVAKNSVLTVGSCVCWRVARAAGLSAQLTVW